MELGQEDMLKMGEDEKEVLKVDKDKDVLKVDKDKENVLKAD